MAQNPYNENDLLQRTAEGDEKAFGILYGMYSDKVYSIAIKLLKSPSLAEDVLQEVFIRVWTNNKKLSDVTHFRAYLYTITRNHIYDILRKKANEELLLTELAGKAPEHSQEEALNYKQLNEHLHLSLTKLPVQQRKVFELGKLQGLKHEEIAKMLLISSETVKKHMMAAMRAVKNFFF